MIKKLISCVWSLVILEMIFWSLMIKGKLFVLKILIKMKGNKIIFINSNFRRKSVFLIFEGIKRFKIKFKGLRDIEINPGFSIYLL